MKPPYIKLYVKDLICDSLDMTDEELGAYMKTFFKAYRTGTIPKAFADHSLFKELHSSSENYEKVCEKNKTNGKRGGRPKKTTFENTVENTDTSETQWVNFGNPNETQKEPTLVNQEPITNNQELLKKKSIKKKEESETPLDIPSYIPEDLLLDFFQHRKDLKKAMSHRAKELLISKIINLYNDGNDPTKLLEAAIERGWQTVYETKETKTNGRKHNAETWHNGNNGGESGEGVFFGHEKNQRFPTKLTDYERKIINVRRNLGLES